MSSQESGGPDLWPTDFGNEDLVPPATILREQAEYLGQKTKNVVTAIVEPTVEKGRFIAQGSFLYSMWVFAPALDYRFQLLTISHSVVMYPVKVHPNVPIEGVESFAAAQTSGIEVPNEKELRSLLKKILNSPKTVQVVGSLLAQSTG